MQLRHELGKVGIVKLIHEVRNDGEANNNQ